MGPGANHGRHGAKQPGNRQQRARQGAGHCGSLPETAGSRRRALPRREDEIRTLEQTQPVLPLGLDYGDCTSGLLHNEAGASLGNTTRKRSVHRGDARATPPEASIARQTHLLGRFTVAVAWSPSMWEPNPPARILGGWPGGFPPVVNPLAKLAHKLVDQQPRHSHDDRCRHPLTESRGKGRHRAGHVPGTSRLSRTLAPRRGGC